MILWLWGSLSRDFDHLGGLADVQDFVDKRKQKLSFLSIFLLSLVPWMQTSCSRTMLLQLELTQLLAAIAIGMYVYIAILLFQLLCSIVIVVYPPMF
jgi:hypothetical protein